MSENTNTEREAFASIGEDQAFEAWFKMDCPVYGINAKLAAKAAWQARASLSLPAAGQEPVAWRVRRLDAPDYWIVFLHYPVDAMMDPEREVQPLYAAPQPAVAAGLDKALAPLRAWWAMHEAQWALCDEIPSDDTVVLHFMGSGASTMVTAGQMRAALVPLPPAPSTEGA